MAGQPEKLSPRQAEHRCSSQCDHRCRPCGDPVRTQVIVLKGPRAVQRLQDLIHRHMSSSEAGSPLYSVFLICGRPVYSPEDLHLSYHDVCRLMKRRFFCSKEQHVLTYYELEHRTVRTDCTRPDYARILSQLVSASRKSQIRTVLSQMSADFSQDEHFVEDLSLLRFMIGNLFLETKKQIQKQLSGHPVSFPEDEEIIRFVGKSDYLYQIIDRMSEILEACISDSGLPAGNGVIDSITDYMGHHLSEQLTLAGIADLYHYNRSYLGKLFLKVTGENFNQYLDNLRIEESKRLLADQDLKIYEIAGRCGYSSVDYFHKKFRRATGMSPMEFRQQEENGSQF